MDIKAIRMLAETLVDVCAEAERLDALAEERRLDVDKYKELWLYEHKHNPMYLPKADITEAFCG